jgi:hypothetical protein
LGIDPALHQQGIDTITPAGKAMFQMMGVFAEFERSMIVERVRAGVARAKANGTRAAKPSGARAHRRPLNSESVTLLAGPAFTRSPHNSVWQLAKFNGSRTGENGPAGRRPISPDLMRWMSPRFGDCNKDGWRRRQSRPQVGA